MIWIIGTGQMAKEYGKVLNSLGKKYIAIGRGEDNCLTFEKELQIPVHRGGLSSYLETKPNLPDRVIVAVGIESLAETTMLLLNFGVLKILLEKPGIGNPDEIDDLVKSVSNKGANVLLAYNRRFYTSVFKAQEIIESDGGVVSLNFEFTEWSHVIGNLIKSKTEHNNWFLGNSTHVIDTAFYLGGKPKVIASFVKGGLEWHPKSSIFSGAGETQNGALFSYQANWEGPGRWALEIITPKSRLIFKPMESLQIQKIGSVEQVPVALDDKFDKEFKPGIYLQTKAFVNDNFERFCNIEEQQNNLKNYYLRMSNYKLN